MINLILAHDDLNNDLGDFFRLCALDLWKDYNSSKNHHIREINGKLMASEYVQEEIGNLNEQSFLFVSYSHGANDALLYNENTSKFVSIENAYFFGKSLFYTFSCHSGKYLGKELIERHSCKGFIGYSGKAGIISFYEDVFLRCANYGIKLFLKGEELGVAFNKMLDKHENEIDAIYELEDTYDHPLISQLVKNKNALVLLGDYGMKITDFDEPILG